MNTVEIYATANALRFRCVKCSNCCRLMRSISIENDKMKSYEELSEKKVEFKKMLESLKNTTGDTFLDITSDGYLNTKDYLILFIQLIKVSNGDLHLEDIQRIRKLTVAHLDDRYPEIKENVLYKHMVDLLAKKASCTFLTKEGLCYIQTNLGKQDMPLECQSYPRIFFRSVAGIGLGLNYSCPEAAALLKGNDLLKNIKCPPELLYCKDMISIPSENEILQIKEIFKLLDLLIDIIRIKELNFNIRLAITGKILKDCGRGNIGDAVRCFHDNYYKEIYALTNVEPDLNEVCRFYNDMMESIVSKMIFPGKEAAKICRNASHLASSLNGRNPAGKIKVFLEKSNKYYGTYHRDIENVFENYFINYLYTSNMCCFQDSSEIDKMLFLFILMQFLIISMCILQKSKVDEDMVIRIIYNLEQILIVNKDYPDELIRSLKHDHLSFSEVLNFLI